MRRQVARAAIGLGDRDEHVDEPIEIAREHRLDHLFPCGVFGLRKRRMTAGEPRIDPLEAPDAMARHEDAAELIEELVSRRAVHRPGVRQHFASEHDLLDDHIER